MFTGPVVFNEINYFCIVIFLKLSNKTAVTSQQPIPHFVRFDPGDVFSALQQFYRPLDDAIEIDAVFIV